MATKSVLGGDYSLDERTDEQLVDLARAEGSRTGAWDELYRRHAGTARSVARHVLHSRNDADDVVNDAFAGVIAAIGRGAGPRTNFCQYLMACVRNGCNQRVLSSSKTVTTDPSVLEQRHAGVFEDAERAGEDGVVAAAYSALSIDLQRALWMTTVEQRSVEFVSKELGRRPSAVAALNCRARDAFIEAYVSEHLQRVSAPSCERVCVKLAHFVRRRAGDVDTARIEHHLARCGECTRAVDDLRGLDASLRSLALPASIVGSGGEEVSAAPISGVGIDHVGWTASFGRSAALAKVAIVAAVLLPTAILARESARSDSTIRESSSALASDESADPEPPAYVASSPTLASTLLIDPTFAGGPGLTPAGVTPSTVAANLSALSGTDDSPAGGRSSPMTNFPLATPPSEPSAEQDAVQTPVTQTPVTQTPAAQTPAAQTPATIAAVATPQISVVPSVPVPVVSAPTPVIPSSEMSITEVAPVTAAPAVTIAPIVVPSASVPSVTVAPSVVVSSTVLQVVAVEPIAVTPLTIAELPLPSLPPLPLPKLSNLFDSGNES